MCCEDQSNGYLLYKLVDRVRKVDMDQILKETIGDAKKFEPKPLVN